MEWMIRFIASYTFITRNYRQYNAIADLHTFHFTVTHALGFSVSTSRIPATDLSQPHCNFKSHMKSSSRRLIPFLALLFCDCQFRRLDSPFSATLIYSLLLLFFYLVASSVFLIVPLHEPLRKQRVLLTRRVYPAVA
jgi:hypothetical protein